MLEIFAAFEQPHNSSGLNSEGRSSGHACKACLMGLFHSAEKDGVMMPLISKCHNQFHGGGALHGSSSYP